MDRECRLWDKSDHNLFDLSCPNFNISNSTGKWAGSVYYTFSVATRAFTVGPRYQLQASYSDMKTHLLARMCVFVKTS